jgi:RNA polymerase sigma factor (sigma-70 family)
VVTASGVNLFIFNILLSIVPEKVSKSTAEAFTAFYNDFLPRVFRYFSYKITDIHQAEDLTSIVFEKALTKFESYRSEKASLATWIFTIARNTLFDHFRSSSQQKNMPLDEVTVDPEDDETPEQSFLEKEESRMLRKCILKLSTKEQEIISLKFGADMNNRQIARTLGLSDSNVGIILYRAVRKLREDFVGSGK